jgi:hypothetical protein
MLPKSMEQGKKYYASIKRLEETLILFVFEYYMPADDTIYTTEGYIHGTKNLTFWEK